MITSNVDEFARGLARRAQNLDRAQLEGTKAAGKHVRGQIEAAAKRVTGDLRLSGTRRNAQLGIRETVKTGDPSSVTLKAVGPWPLVEQPLKAHRIPKLRTRRTRRVRKILLIPGIGYRASANHPGVHRASGPWKQGSDRGLAGVQRIYRQAVRDVISS